MHLHFFEVGAMVNSSLAGNAKFTERNEGMTDREAFLAKVRMNNTTCAKVSEEIGIDPASLSAKLNGKSDFTVSEVSKLATVLKLSKKDIDTIFFN